MVCSGIRKGAGVLTRTHKCVHTPQHFPSSPGQPSPQPRPWRNEGCFSRGPRVGFGASTNPLTPSKTTWRVSEETIQFSSDSQEDCDLPNN